MSSFTLDASVVTNAFSPDEDGYEISLQLLRQLADLMYPVFVPTIFYPEVAAAFSRSKQNRAKAAKVLQDVKSLSMFRPVDIDYRLSDQAARFAIDFRLRGADSTYVAVAYRYSAILVSHDDNHLKRVSTVDVLTSAEALARITT